MKIERQFGGRKYEFEIYIKETRYDGDIQVWAEVKDKSGYLNPMCIAVISTFSIADFIEEEGINNLRKRKLK